jgi:hypothetical protein
MTDNHMSRGATPLGQKAFVRPDKWVNMGVAHFVRLSLNIEGATEKVFIMQIYNKNSFIEQKCMF